MSAAYRPRILVAEDDPSFLYTVRRMLQSTYDVVGEAANGALAVQLADELRPDIALLDISMPLMTGLEAARLIRAQHPEIRIIVVSSLTNPASIEEAYGLGACGFVRKDAAFSQLPTAIRDALDGKLFRAAYRAEGGRCRFMQCYVQ